MKHKRIIAAGALVAAGAMLLSGCTPPRASEVVKGTKLEPVYATILPAHRDRTDALKRDLERIGAVAAEAQVQKRPAASASGSVAPRANDPGRGTSAFRHA